jgi:hypothetical protein
MHPRLGHYCVPARSLRMICADGVTGRTLYSMTIVKSTLEYCIVVGLAPV